MIVTASGIYALRHGFRAPLALLIPLLVSSCLTNPSGPPSQEPTTITLSTYRIVFTAVNDHVRIDATVLDQDSRVIADATVNWRSADNAVARVSDRGVVTAAGSGTTQITVTSGYATATATVSVDQAADSIEITPSSITLTRVGQTGQFTAVVHDANDRIIPGAEVVWSSSNPEIATVDANGLVTAVSPGDALVTASSGGVLHVPSGLRGGCAGAVAHRAQCNGGDTVGRGPEPAAGRPGVRFGRGSHPWRGGDVVEQPSGGRNG